MRDRQAFAPFFQGRFGCVGKNLALMEIRAVTAALLSRFDMRFANEERRSDVRKGEGEELEVELGDQFTMTVGKLELVFTERGA